MKFVKVCVVLLAVVQSVSAQLTPPPQGYVLRFNGTQVALAPVVQGLNLDSTFTMEAWVFVETVQPYAVIMGKPNDDRSADPYMHYVLEFGSGGHFEFAQSTGQAGSYRTATSPDTVTLKEWTHLAAVLANDTLHLYVNGIEVANFASAGSPIDSTPVLLALGAGVAPNGSIVAGGFSGAIRQARVWNIALTTSEIQTLATTEVTGSEAGLVVCWPLDDGIGATARAIGDTTLALTLGNSSGGSAPSWIQTEVLNNLDSYFRPTIFQLPSSLSGLQDAIPFDLDDDDDLDIIITDLIWPPTIPGTQRSIVIMQNDGEGGFTSVNESWVDTIKFVHPRHWTIADFTMDGEEDLVIVDHGTDVTPFPGDQNRILLKSGGTLVEETGTRIPAANDFTHNVASGDINGDGFPDIYVCNIFGGGQVGPRFYMNNGSGIFTVDTLRLPANVKNLQQVYMSSILVDVDKDGDLDLVLGGLDGDGFGANFPKDGLLLNNGSGQFAFASSTAMPDRAQGNAGGTVAISSADFNNDSWPDLLMATLYQYRIPLLQLLLNNQNGTFRDESWRIPQSWPTAENFGNSWVRWTFPADFNNDGHIDFLAVGQNESPSKVYMNNGNGTFRDISDYISFGAGVQACAVNDFNGDGRTDIVALRNDKSAVFLKNIEDFPVTSVREEVSTVPMSFSLEAPYPNPFNPSTTIRFSVEKTGRAVVRSYDLLGRVVRTLYESEAQAGITHQVMFDGTGLTSGMYFIRMESGGQIATQKVMLVK